jgi:hypothetical protein
MIVFDLLTFPGVLLREALRLFACQACDLGIFRLRFFPGQILHERLTTTRSAALLALPPVLLAYPLAVSFCLPAVLAWELGAMGWVEWGLLWLGLALASQAMPPSDDARNLWLLASESKSLWLLPAAPVYALHRAGPILGVAIPPLVAYLLSPLF